MSEKLYSEVCKQPGYPNLVGVYTEVNLVFTLRCPSCVEVNFVWPQTQIKVEIPSSNNISDTR